jgi:hypothetical protein
MTPSDDKEFQPKVLTWNGRRTVVYDWDLCQRFIKSWRAQGMSREDVLELLFSP